MVKIQIDLPNHLDKKVKVIQALRGLYDKRDTIVWIIEKYEDELYQVENE